MQLHVVIFLSAFLLANLTYVKNEKRKANKSDCLDVVNFNSPDQQSVAEAPGLLGVGDRGPGGDSQSSSGQSQASGTQSTSGQAQSSGMLSSSGQSQASGTQSSLSGQSQASGTQSSSGQSQSSGSQSSSSGQSQASGMLSSSGQSQSSGTQSTTGQGTSSSGAQGSLTGGSDQSSATGGGQGTLSGDLQASGSGSLTDSSRSSSGSQGSASSSGQSSSWDSKDKVEWQNKAKEGAEGGLDLKGTKEGKGQKSQYFEANEDCYTEDEGFMENEMPHPEAESEEGPYNPTSHFFENLIDTALKNLENGIYVRLTNNGQKNIDDLKNLIDGGPGIKFETESGECYEDGTEEDLNQESEFTGHPQNTEHFESPNTKNHFEVMNHESEDENPKHEKLDFESDEKEKSVKKLKKESASMSRFAGLQQDRQKRTLRSNPESHNLPTLALGTFSQNRKMRRNPKVRKFGRNLKNRRKNKKHALRNKRRKPGKHVKLPPVHWRRNKSFRFKKHPV